MSKYTSDRTAPSPVPSALNWPSNFISFISPKVNPVKSLNAMSTLFHAPEVTGTVTKNSAGEPETNIGVTLIVLTLASATQISICNFSIAEISVFATTVPW